MIKRETAYKMAIEALTKERRTIAFDHHIATYFPATKNEKIVKKWQRYTDAIAILEAERDHKQMELFA